MWKVGVWISLAAATLNLIVSNHKTMNPWIAFLLSLLATFFLGAGGTAKREALARGTATLAGRIAIGTLAGFILYGPALDLPKISAWPGALVFWLGLLMAMVVWVPAGYSGGSS